MDITLPTSRHTLVPGKILCIGRNYALHAREMGSEAPETPILFLKPSSALVGNGGRIVLPPQSQDVLVFEDKDNPQRFHTLDTTDAGCAAHSRYLKFLIR